MASYFFFVDVVSYLTYLDSTYLMYHHILAHKVPRVGWLLF